MNSDLDESFVAEDENIDENEVLVAEDENIDENEVLEFEDKLFQNDQLTIIFVDNTHIAITCNQCLHTFREGAKHIFTSLNMHFNSPQHGPFRKQDFAKEISQKLFQMLLSYQSTLKMPIPPIDPELAGICIYFLKLFYLLLLFYF